MGTRRAARRPSIGRRIAAWAALLVAMHLPTAAVARDDARLQRLSQHGHAVWRTQDGAFGSPNAIAQGKDGYLYLGTNAGLVRFDGARFVAVNVYPEGSIADWRIVSVLATADGSLWIGAAGHVARLRDGHLTRHDFTGTPFQMVEDADGAVWFAKLRGGTGDAPVCRVDATAVQCHGRPEISFSHATVIRRADHGEFWIGTSSGLCRWMPGSPARCFLEKALQPLAGLQGVTAVATTRDGALWVGIGKAGPEYGLGQLVDGRWRPFAAKGLDGSSLVVATMLEARDGSLWVGTADRGVYRIRGDDVDHFGAEDGLSGNTVSPNGLLEDAEGTVWVATATGVDAFRALPVSVFSTREGLEADSVESVLAARDGTVWIGNLSLSTIVGDRVGPPPLPAFFHGKDVTAMLEDFAGRLWVGLGNALYVLRDGAPVAVTARDGGPFGAVQAMIEDQDHDVWVMTVGRPALVLRVHDFVVVDDVTERLGDLLSLSPHATRGLWAGRRNGELVHLDSGAVRTLSNEVATGAGVYGVVSDADGLVLATTSRGLWVVQGASQRMLDKAHGLPCDDLRTVMKDAGGNLWMPTSCGLVRLGRAEFTRWRAHPDTRIAYRVFDVTEGFQSGTGVFTPRNSLGADGRLWFANGKIAQVIDPAAPETRSAPPPVRIEEINADRIAYPVGDPVRLPPNPRNIDIRFTALTFVVPQKVRFLYRLEGRDTEWRDPGAIRQASYTDLRPGRYRFHVKAANSDGVWNEDGASTSFEIAPAYYQTPWFIALVVAFAFALLYGVYVVRLRQVASRIRERVSAKNDERERIARNLHDTLLQGTQALIYNVHAETGRLPSADPARARLERALANADDLITEGRERIEELRIATDVDSDLCESLYRVGDALASNHGIAFEAIVEGAVRPLRANVHDEVYQIAREALLNAFQHSRAKSVECHLLYGDDQFRLRVRDDGIGLDPAILETGARAKHWGLLGMRERAEALGAVVDVWSSAGNGTEIEFRIPGASAYRHPAVRRRWSLRRPLRPD